MDARNPQGKECLWRKTRCVQILKYHIQIGEQKNGSIDLWFVKIFVVLR
uniref:Uncharacterized protein n=1 Tax=Anguilla anguilla TaxID=7936 RepID=A0A0E9WSE0_ANGAN